MFTKTVIFQIFIFIYLISIININILADDTETEINDKKDCSERMCEKQFDIEIISMSRDKECSWVITPNEIENLLSNKVFQFSSYPAAQYCFFDKECSYNGELFLIKENGEKEKFNFEVESGGVITLRNDKNSYYLGCPESNFDWNTETENENSACKIFEGGIWDCGV